MSTNPGVHEVLALDSRTPNSRRIPAPMSDPLLNTAIVWSSPAHAETTPDAILVGEHMSDADVEKPMAGQLLALVFTFPNAKSSNADPNMANSSAVANRTTISVLTRHNPAQAVVRKTVEKNNGVVGEYNLEGRDAFREIGKLVDKLHIQTPQVRFDHAGKLQLSMRVF